jgi:hypothetical protein
MSRSDRFPWKPLVAGIAGVGLIAWSTIALRRIATIDPFASIRSTMNPRKNEEVTVQLGDVSVRFYEEAKLRGQARVGRLGITRDRMSLQCFAVTDGVYYTAKGDPFRFSASEAVWSQVGRTFEGRKAARVWAKDLDLKVEQFAYNQTSKIISVPGPLKGKLSGGDVEANGFWYQLTDNSYRLGPLTWVGQLDQVPDAEKKGSRWTIKAQSTSRASGSDVEVSKNAWATDGDVIIKAALVERNVKTDVVVATGKVPYFSKKANLLCDKVTIYRKEKRAVLEGNVSMLIKPEDQERLEEVELQPLRPIVPEEIAAGRPAAPTGKTDEEKQLDDEVRSTQSRRKYPVAVLAARIEYWYREGERRAEITGAPQAKQDLAGGRWRQVWAFKGYYDGEKETLRLDSTPTNKDVRIMTSLGDDIRAKWFEVSTKEDDDAWSAEDLDGVFVADEDEIPKAPGSNKGTGGAGGSATGGGGSQPPPGLRGPIGGR